MPSPVAIYGEPNLKLLYEVNKYDTRLVNGVPVTTPVRITRPTTNTTASTGSGGLSDVYQNSSGNASSANTDIYLLLNYLPPGNMTVMQEGVRSTIDEYSAFMARIKGAQYSVFVIRNGVKYGWDHLSNTWVAIGGL